MRTMLIMRYTKRHQSARNVRRGTDNTYRRALVATAAAFLPCILAMPGFAYPEFQQSSEATSGKTTDCAMCHISSAGPVGEGEGQIGSFKDKEMERLNKARSALEAGVEVDSPILNRFGNSLVKALGRKKLLELRAKPAELAKFLDANSDLDDDGISDGQEYLDGTDPLNKYHGSPLKLLLVNLDRGKQPIILAIISVALTSYGLMQFVHGFATMGKRKGTIEPGAMK